MSALAAVAAALWLGILTSISPCPLATNIAAVSFIARLLDTPARVVASGLAYTLGRAAAYVLLAAVLVTSLLSAPQVSHFLQKYLGMALGPILVIAGMFLLELLTLPSFGARTGAAWQRRAASLGVAGAALLGFVFALSFCPISAALYFGSLLPIAVEQQSPLLLPALYGAGTALPVLLFGLLIAFGARSVGLWFNRLNAFGYWARRATGVVFILVGVYLTLTHVLG
ncbi:MAG TPA: aromatic aminobenezylarsenical efflux permease ArsG family transporter [Candidatus Hydrogenedentes bacterium]|nr:aromatic aminobenezylarsenical efflux permease ArsG family transporter [Candidatus Hydrogenedentota bacterium]HNT87405.1 aromatic aminobenezylarsenical efflux permease ArsG family transporter [Candidatus Hydrogenedentota bacterium]